MGVISRLPQGGGGGGFIFNITTTESSLFGQDIIITGAEPTKTVTFSADGKATAKAKKAGTYTFTCGGAVYSQEYQLYGEYPVELNLYDAVITVTGKVQLAPPMDSRYIVPDGYYKPNNVDGMQVSLYDGASQIAIPQAFSGGGDTVTFTVDTREHTNVTVKFSDEGAKGFTNPADVPLTLEKGVPASASGTWVEKYAELEVQKMDAELLPFDVILKWGETANEQITWTTDNVSDKSKFIVKKAGVIYTATCSDISDTRNVSDLSQPITPIELSTKIDPVPLVPIISSDVTVYGDTIYNNYESGYYPYMAFDGKDSTGWSSGTASGAGTNEFIGFKFKELTCVNGVSFKQGNASAYPLTYCIEGSNDGTTWDNVSGALEFDTTRIKELQSKNFDNRKKYYYWRFRQLTPRTTANVNLYLHTLQFYGYQ